MTLEEALDELYGSPPDRFVEVRERLGKQLRAGGDTAAAGALRTQRKPTRPAWALNQLVRREPDAVDSLEEAGRRLEQAQQRVVSGASPGEEMRAARRGRDDLVQRLVATAAELLDQDGNATPHLDEIAATLEAASVDASSAEQLRRGRLVKPLPLPTTFGTVGLQLLEGEGVPETAEQKRELRARRDQQREEITRIMRALAAAERDERRARDEAEQLARDAERARARAEERTRDVERLREGLTAAQELLGRLEAELS